MPTIFKNCTLSIFYEDRPADLEIACIVALSDRELELKYDQEDGSFWSWKGDSKGDGHFVLFANQQRHLGRATLHRLPGSMYLEGYWLEGSYKGMWRVKLGTEFN